MTILRQLGIVLLACWLSALLLLAILSALCGSWWLSLMFSCSLWMTFQIIDDASDDLDAEEEE